MNKSKKMLFVFSLTMLMTTGLLSSCNFSFNNGGSAASNDPIKDVYVLYQDNGGDLSYDDWLATIKGEKGDKGDTGDTGATGAAGTNGTNGTDGTNGTSILTGAGAPASTLGSDGDSYVNTANWDYYTKTSGAWTLKGNLKGGTGTAGATGATGATGTKGSDGTSVLTGSGEPSSDLGSNGDSYINLSNWEYYVKADGVWVDEGSIKGATGATGASGTNGTAVRMGSGAPASTLGIDGDSYINTDNLDYYVKSSGSWSNEGNLKGTTGATGATGATGSTGATAYSSTILPTSDGYASVNKGSAIVGEDVVFSFVCTDSTKDLISFTLNGTKHSMTEATKASTGHYTYTTPMVENGFVVSAAFNGVASVSSATELTSAASNSSVGLVKITDDIDLVSSSVSVASEKVFVSGKTGSNPTITSTANIFSIGNLDDNDLVAFDNLNMVSTGTGNGNGRCITGQKVTDGSLYANKLNLTFKERGISLGTWDSTKLDLTVKNSTLKGNKSTIHGDGAKNMGGDRGINYYGFYHGKVDIENNDVDVVSYPLYICNNICDDPGDITYYLDTNSFYGWGCFMQTQVNIKFHAKSCSFKGENHYNTDSNSWSAFECGCADGSTGNNETVFDDCSFTAIDQLNDRYNGSGAPTADLGVVGATYVNTANYDHYTKTASGWGDPDFNYKTQYGDSFTAVDIINSENESQGSLGDYRLVLKYNILMQKQNYTNPDTKVTSALWFSVDYQDENCVGLGGDDSTFDFNNCTFDYTRAGNKELDPMIYWGGYSTNITVRVDGVDKTSDIHLGYSLYDL